MTPTRTSIVEHVTDICERFKHAAADTEVTSDEVEQFEAEIGSKLADCAELLEADLNTFTKSESTRKGGTSHA